MVDANEDDFLDRVTKCEQGLDASGRRAARAAEQIGNENLASHHTGPAMAANT
jgi:hypothetical protein